MWRRLFLILSTLAAGAVAYLAWTRRDELRRELERVQGEWRSGVRDEPGPARRPGAASRETTEGTRTPPSGSSTARAEPDPAAAAGAPDEPRPRCAAETRSGRRCSRPAEPGSQYCWQHAAS